eukprot:g1820.t1
MQSLAFGEAMKAAAEDYKKELLESEASSRKAVHSQVDVGGLSDDPELQKLHAARLKELREEAEQNKQDSELLLKGHGNLSEINEGDFLEVVTKTKFVVCHFFHEDFQRCKILDKHLSSLARKYIKTRFIKLSAMDAPFFTAKLKVQVLPCLMWFVNGVAVGRLVGFDELSGKDDFSTSCLENRLLNEEVIQPVTKAEESVETSRVRRGLMYGKLDSEDESSDFDE